MCLNTTSMNTSLLFSQKSWFAFLDEDQRQLVLVSEYLYEREERLNSRIADYSFIVFPMAKAYEGFLKEYLHSLKILPKQNYDDRKFRIGRALNPDISEKHKNEWWLYDDLIRACDDKTARELWDAWVECRNHVFHFFSDQKEELSLSVAQKRLVQLSNAMDQAMQCLWK